MVKISLRFGAGEVTGNIPDKYVTTIVQPGPALNLPITEQVSLVTRALHNPVGTKRLIEMGRGKTTAAIVVSDGTRLVPTSVLLPPVLEELKAAGINNDGITIVVGVGNHRPVTEEEKTAIVGADIYKSYRCKHSREGPYVRVGVTSRGTPVEISRFVAEADLKILTGNIEMHRLAGFSGGPKGCVGISSPRALEHNHRLSRLGSNAPGSLEGNIVQADLSEYARIAGIDCILNVVTDHRGNVEAAVAGDVIEAHQKGIPLAEKKYRIPIEEPVDLVIVSAGGVPKDSALYQAVKALQNAMDVLRPGGQVILVAACPEGFGDPCFREWMLTGKGIRDIVGRGEKEFRLGGHKAVALAQLLMKGEVYLVSLMGSKEVEAAGMRPCVSLQDAIDNAVAKFEYGRIIVLPFGGVTFPYIMRQTAASVQLGRGELGHGT